MKKPLVLTQGDGSGDLPCGWHQAGMAGGLVSTFLKIIHETFFEAISDIMPAEKARCVFSRLFAGIHKCRGNDMKKKWLLIVAAAGIGFAAFATGRHRRTGV